MSKQYLPEGETIYSVYREAFNFLRMCDESQFNMTSIDAISEAPRAVSDLISTVGSVGYSQIRGKSKGEPELLGVCTEFFKNDRRIECAAENVSLNWHITDCIEKTYKHLRLLRDGKKVLVPTPTFGYYFEQLASSDISFETIATRPENGFLLDRESLEEAIINSGAKVLLLCYPNNPTGVVMTQENAEMIAEIARIHDIFIISDEAFVRNNLTEKKHVSIASIPGMLERSLTITSSAKSVGIPYGARLGFCVGPEAIVTQFAELGGFPPRQFQMAIAESLKDNEENLSYSEENKAKYFSNINLVKEKLVTINQIFGHQLEEEKSYVRPYIETPETGGPYLLDFSALRGKNYKGKTLSTGLDIAKWLLNEASVGVVPGECFCFDENDMLVRIAVSLPAEEIVRAFDSITSVVQTIQNPPKVSAEAIETVKFSGSTNLGVELDH